MNGAGPAMAQRLMTGGAQVAPAPLPLISSAPQSVGGGGDLGPMVMPPGMDLATLRMIRDANRARASKPVQPIQPPGAATVGPVEATALPPPGALQQPGAAEPGWGARMADKLGMGGWFGSGGAS